MILTVHLLLGAYSAGQRDFLMAIAAVATAWGAASVAENPGPRRAVLFAVGACAHGELPDGAGDRRGRCWSAF